MRIRVHMLVKRNRLAKNRGNDCTFEPETRTVQKATQRSRPQFIYEEHDGAKEYMYVLICMVSYSYF